MRKSIYADSKNFEIIVSKFYMIAFYVPFSMLAIVVHTYLFRVLIGCADVYWLHYNLRTSD